MSGDLKRATGEMDLSFGSGPSSLGGMVGRKLANGRQSPTSPLKLFGHAKKKINDIFIDITEYINEGHAFLRDDRTGLIEAIQVELLKKYTDKVAGIREILSRDRMKVAFFGRTSNGKSTVINAMLRNRILPSGIGHTTNCFLQVEGTDGHEAFIITEEAPNDRKSVQSISQLASALSKFKLDPNTLIRICWPKDMCSLLRDDVVLVDSPGIDVSPDLDTWIDKFCRDADVFVLVANAESTLMQTEKNFFHRVSERLSAPNIFILNNRWDASASEIETMHEVKQQHLERNIAFLADELKVVTQHEAEDHVFFVSAREALTSRVNQDRGTPTPSEQMHEGFQGRLFEFANFERKFEACISQSAVETKFAHHTNNGKQITRELYIMMDQILSSVASQRDQFERGLTEKENHLLYTDEQLSVLTKEIEDKIRQMTEEVERKVSSALTDEIRRLAVLVDEFNQPFDTNPMVLNQYKKELHAHVENGLGRNLQNRCSSTLRSTIENTTAEMSEQLIALIPRESQHEAVSGLVPGKKFEMAFHLDCRNFCADFCEDIEFRFSFGITSLMRRFLGVKGVQQRMRGYTEIQRPMSMSSQDLSGPAMQQAVQEDNELMLTLLTTFSSLYSGTTVGVLAIAALLGKAAGWRVIAVGGAVYGLLYVYERLMWTSKAKEQTFKRQYVDYAGSKLRLIVDLTSKNCSHQVKTELNSAFDRLCHQVNLTKTKLREELQTLEVSIEQLKEANKKASFLKNKAQYIDTELDNFILQFLKPDSRL